MPATNLISVTRMTNPKRAFTAGRRLLMLAALVGGAGMFGCDQITDPLLEFRDPDIINPEDITTAEGADALRLGAFGRLNTMTSGGESVLILGGLLADEFRSGDTFIQRNETDQRSIDTTNSFMVTAARQLHRTHVLANYALTALRQYKPTPRDLQGQMFFVRGFAENMAAESFCSGIPFSDASQDPIVYGEALSTEQVLVKAQESADSAIANLPDSARFRFAAMVLKGRALLNRGQYDSARIAVAAVPLSHQYSAVHTSTGGTNQIWALNNSIRRYVVADNEGTNGLPFVSANDPRLRTRIGVTSDSSRDFEGRTGMVFNLKYPVETSPVVLTSGLEAKLIIAEALLNAGNATWIDTLNALRASPPGYTNSPALAALVDPGTQPARVDLLFRERAFWMWGTGHRLGDMRRLIRQYGRAQNTVFPIGTFKNGGPYGTDVNLPITASERNNPKYTASCNKSQA